MFDFRLFRCDALCPGRWSGGQFSSLCTTHSISSVIRPEIIQAAEIRNPSSTISSLPLIPRPRIPSLMNLRLPPPSHFLRPSMASSQAACSSDNHSFTAEAPAAMPSFAFNSSDFLIELRRMIVSAIQWTRHDTPLVMLSRSGEDFPRLPIPVRTAIITAALIVRNQENIGTVLSSEQVEENHQAFLLQYNTWMNQRNDNDTVEDLDLDDLI